jgi:hypothetical protein
MMKFLQSVTANKVFFLSLIGLFFTLPISAEVSAWDCYKLEGAKIIAEDGTYLGTLDDSYKSDSIYNEYSEHGSDYSSSSIWNEYSEYGSEYSSSSAFNEYSSDPPVLLKDGEVIGKLTTREYALDGYDARELKKDCDWD